MRHKERGPQKMECGTLAVRDMLGICLTEVGHANIIHWTNRRHLLTYVPTYSWEDFERVAKFALSVSAAKRKTWYPSPVHCLFTFHEFGKTLKAKLRLHFHSEDNIQMCQTTERLPCYFEPRVSLSYEGKQNKARASSIKQMKDTDVNSLSRCKRSFEDFTVSINRAKNVTAC
jgi:hypothetical protein